MKKDRERQVGVRVGLPVFFAMELEDVYRHTEGAHRALAFPDFCGLLIGLGLEVYRKGNGTLRPKTEQEKAPGTGRPVPLPVSRREENKKAASAPGFQGCFKSEDYTPRIGNRSDALQLIEGIMAELNHTQPKLHYLQAGLKALKDAIKREIF
jgi:hypothetical protein